MQSRRVCMNPQQLKLSLYHLYDHTCHRERTSNFQDTNDRMSRRGKAAGSPSLAILVCMNTRRPLWSSWRCFGTCIPVCSSDRTSRLDTETRIGTLSIPRRTDMRIPRTSLRSDTYLFKEGQDIFESTILIKIEHKSHNL